MTPRDERGREQVRMRVTLSFDYMAPVDPDVYEGTTAPHRMAAIDAENSPEALIEFAGRRPVLVSVEPVLDAAPSLPAGGGDGRDLQAELDEARAIAGLALLFIPAARHEDFVERCRAMKVQPPVSSSAGDEAREALERAARALKTAREYGRAALNDLAQRLDAYDRANPVYAAELRPDVLEAARRAVASSPSARYDDLQVAGLLNAVNRVLCWVALNRPPMDGDDQQEIWAMLDGWEQLTGLEHDERAAMLDGRYAPAPADEETTR